MNESIAQTIGETTSRFSLDNALANQLLLSTLVKYLADKQVIELQDYLDYHQKMQNHLEEFIKDEVQQSLIKLFFEAHRKDFEKPE